MAEVQQIMDNVAEEITIPAWRPFTDHCDRPIRETKALKDKLDFDTNQLQ